MLSLFLLGAAPVSDQARLAAAKRAAAAADARARLLERDADEARDAADRARVREAAVAERIRAAEAEITAARAQAALTARALGSARETLAERQAPIQRLVAALQSLARRPAALSVAQPGSVDEVVHVRAVLGTVLPVVQARSRAVRAEIARAERLRASAVAAAQALAAGQARLQRERLALVQLQGAERLRGATLDRSALVESDRALALGERARELVDRLGTAEDAAQVRAALAALPGPLPRPERGIAEPRARFGTAPYRLPAAGRVVEGLGELSTSGVRARGVTLLVAPGALVRAPAAGRIVFARPFRDYGGVVIIDHGDGWSSAVIGLDAIAATVGGTVASGAPLGRAVLGDEPRITVELRRRGQAVDLAQLIG
ncbi:Septal ring factor EnvC, activator of murein hydrolases AmiA and AmiB [Sphingomonas guangdongensis]|uniref:Septal ring factor EnvC, activator of murein hydrolases AmiA and AmiB n=1 Tax=Sphingomonas guangdongensis TaxID=1141890 RepID=A0A285QIU1_9SPHN|nr:Septal ring factor EnvC, activator of murein hydrolases AmiA and AmiB [Sphingomonas guangdongensis]